MTTATVPAPAVAPPAEDDIFIHIFCCDPNLSLCGLDVSGFEEIGPTALLAEHCPLCVLEWESGRPCRPGCTS